MNIEKASVVDAFTDNIIDECCKKSFTVCIDGKETSVITVDNMSSVVTNVMELMKGGAK